MFSFIYMKILESQPSRYDAGISLLTFGTAEKSRLEMVERAIQPGDHVLDVGTGTGALAFIEADRGATVVGIDSAAAMLAVAEEKRTQHPSGNRVKFIEAGVAEMENALAGELFDVVTASLVFSELSEDEQRYALDRAHQLLAPGGRLVIADETRPDKIWKRTIYHIVRLPLAFITFALTQTGTRPVIGLEEKVAAAGFTIDAVERRNLESYLVLYAHK